MRLPIVRLLVLALCSLTAAELAAQTCSKATANASPVAENSTCLRLAQGWYQCDPAVSVHLTPAITKQDPSLPLCAPITWTFDDGSPAVSSNESGTDHAFSKGHHVVHAATSVLVSGTEYQLSSTLKIEAYRGMFLVELVSSADEDYHDETVTENGGSVRLLIGRTNVRDRATVDYTVAEFGPHRVAPMTGTLVFEPGQDVRYIDVLLLDNPYYEQGTTRAEITLSNPTADHGLLTSLVTLHVTEDEAFTGHQCAAQTYDAREADGVANIVVERTGNLDVETVARARVTFEYGEKRDAYAVFARGESRKTIPVNIQDVYYTGTYNVPVSCSGQPKTGIEFPPSTWTGPETSAVLTIVDDEAMPLLTIHPTEVTETDTTQRIQVQVSLFPAFGRTMDIGTEPSPYNPSTDASLPQTSVRVPPLVTSFSVPIDVRGDDEPEIDETYFFWLTTTGGPTIGTLLIHDDDALPSQFAFAQQSYVVQESAKSVTIEVRRSGDTRIAADITVNVITNTGGILFMSVHFDAGATSATSSPFSIDDAVYSGDRTLPLQLRVAGQLVATASLTIIDDEPRPILSIGDVSIAEGGAGDHPQARFSVSMSGLASLPVTFEVATEDGTAIAPADYDRLGPTPMAIAAGSTRAEFSVPIHGDNDAEADETFGVRISACCGPLATLGKSVGIGTIQNDDQDARSSYAFVHDVPLLHDESEGQILVKVKRSGNLAASTTAAIRATDSGAAAQPELGPIDVEFAASETEKQIGIPIDDGVYSGDRSYRLDLVSGAVTYDTLNVSVREDEPLPLLSLHDAAATESASGAQAVFKLTIQPVFGYPITVRPYASSRSATAGSDFEAPPATYTIPAATATAFLNVPILDDAEAEGTENFLFGVSVDAWLGQMPQALGTIFDNDSPATTFPTPSVDPTSLQLTAGTRGSFNVTLAPAPQAPVSVTVHSMNEKFVRTPSLVAIDASGSAFVSVEALAEGKTTIELALPADAGGRTISIPVDVRLPRLRSARH